MGVLDVTLGTDTLSLEVPEGCTVGKWRELVGQGHFGEKVKRVTTLACREDVGGRPLGDSAPLPDSGKLFVDGPPQVLGGVADSLRKRSVMPLSARSAATSSTRTSSHNVRGSQPRFVRQGTGGQPLTARAARHLGSTRNAGEDAAAVLDGEAAAAVLHFWFEELTPEDWFRQSHSLDDKVRREFGVLHQRAAAGELAGWMSRPDTCLALVVILDQFSRNIYGRCTPEGCQWDSMARAAANAALARGDDRQHWPPGPQRSALYLPFMHSEDLADKRRCVALMREGLVPDSSAMKQQSTEKGGGSGRGAAGGTTGLPRLQAAQGSSGRARLPGRKNSVTLPGDPRSGTLDSARAHRHGAHQHAEEEALDDSDGDSDEDDEAVFPGGSGFPSPRGGGHHGRATAAGPGGASAGAAGGGCCGGAAHHKGGGGSAGGAGGGPRHHHHGGGRLSEDAAGSYNMQAALELPHLPVLSLNHEHAKRFRTMKLDAQTHQAYLRDKKDVNRTVKYQCLVCAVTHEFKLSKSAANGAEQQHQHP